MPATDLDVWRLGRVLAGNRVRLGVGRLGVGGLVQAVERAYGRGRPGQRAGHGPGDGHRGSCAVVDAPAVGRLSQAGEQLVEGEVEGCEPVVGRSLGSHERTAPVDGELDAFRPGGHPRVLLRNLHLEANHPGREPVQSGDLVLDLTTETVGYRTMPTLHHDVHANLPNIELTRSNAL